MHQPIVVDSVEALPELPPYVERDHDRHLRGLMSDLATSTLVVLTGESSSGKTRTAMEAVRVCLPDWPVHKPRGLPQLSVLTPRSPAVVWLSGDVAGLGEITGQHHSRGGSPDVVDQRPFVRRGTAFILDQDRTPGAVGAVGAVAVIPCPSGVRAAFNGWLLHFPGSHIAWQAAATW
ncbi:hypothetical protein SD37_10530 [Amycolatopsis orientalis]|uniref:Uncharacterized protein n=1 Tax=Amycolatopsis orientalis TaxID=31958 RepID=A0A193BUY9_AMYOR|nr:hypothetical protein [Amycolatopsis orientalis]ANN16032.1 hypothetical protein SD37_10530 [Amycolatopsis orientalis]